MTYLAWVGSNATHGTPNVITGRLSIYGRLYSFTTRKERDSFCDKFNDKFNSYPVPTNKKDARKYFLGISVSDYEMNLDALISGYVDYV